MAKGVEDFVYGLLTNVFNTTDTAQIVIDEILKNKSYDPGIKMKKIEAKEDWTRDKIIANAPKIISDKGSDENFDD